jgi:hypothetical protein
MGSNELDFLNQIPPILLLSPIFFGILYVILMVYIFRRAAIRRRKAREASEGYVPRPETRKNTSSESSFLGRLTSARDAGPSELHGIPEPDLDDLLAPLTVEEPAVVTPAREEPTTPDWISTVAAPQEETQPMAENSVDVPGDAVEVMRVWRDLSDGSLIIQVGDQRYRHYNEIKNPDLARRFATLIRELWTMVNGGTAARAAEAPSPAASNQMVGLNAKAANIVNGSSAPEAQPQKPGRLQQAVRQALGTQSTTAPQVPRPAGIAGAVEEYLQFKLSNTPEFATRSIHIRSGDDHGIKIEVDGRFFDSIGDVFDPDVREFLFSMMREWEARQ